MSTSYFTNNLNSYTSDGTVFGQQIYYPQQVWPQPIAAPYYQPYIQPWAPTPMPVTMPAVAVAPAPVEAAAPEPSLSEVWAD
jgi:hypothetical protein